MTDDLEIFRIFKLDIVLCGHRQFQGCSDQAAILQTLIGLSINHRATPCNAALPRHIPLAGGSGNQHLAGGCARTPQIHIRSTHAGASAGAKVRIEIRSRFRLLNFNTLPINF